MDQQKYGATVESSIMYMVMNKTRVKIIKQDLKVFVYFDKTWSIDWYKNDRLYREDGPVETRYDSKNYEYYYIDGIYEI